MEENIYYTNDVNTEIRGEKDIKKLSSQELDKKIKETKNEMQKMAKSLHFVEAGKLRDKLFELEKIRSKKKRA